MEEVEMRFCFIVEEQYRNDPMPMVIADQLIQWGHQVDLLEPQTAVTCLSDLAEQGYDAYVLKSLADGPGLSILEAAEAVGIPTINSARSIRLVRDKAVAAAFARAHGLPIPPTYFVAHPRLLRQIPIEDYPLVVKPSNGSSNQGVYLLESPADLASLEIAEANDSFFLAQHYAENTGFDIKVYVTGREVYAAVAKKSPLHPDMGERFVPLTPRVRKLALQVGKLFGLDIYGLDIVDTPQGPAIVDINDFPSFGGVPRAVVRVSEYVLHAAKRAEMQRAAHIERARHREQTHVANKSRESLLEKPITIADNEKVQGDLRWRTDLQPVGSTALPADQQAVSGALSKPSGGGGSISQPIVAGSQSPVSTSGPPKESADETHLSLFAVVQAELEEGDRAYVGRVYFVQAGIAGSKPEDFKAEPIDLTVHDSNTPLVFDILIHVSDNIELQDEWHKRIEFSPFSPATQLGRFMFKLVAAGHSSISIDFYHKQRWLRTVRLEFEAVEQPQLSTASSPV
jgi:ribosomal protein S6--L-glutamate ligase